MNYPTYHAGQLQSLGERVHQTVTQFLTQTEHASIVFSDEDINWYVCVSESLVRMF